MNLVVFTKPAPGSSAHHLSQFPTPHPTRKAKVSLLHDKKSDSKGDGESGGQLLPPRHHRISVCVSVESNLQHYVSWAVSDSYNLMKFQMLRSRTSRTCFIIPSTNTFYTHVLCTHLTAIS
jgi:hypothetical protein